MSNVQTKGHYIRPLTLDAIVHSDWNKTMETQKTQILIRVEKTFGDLCSAILDVSHCQK